MAQDQETTPVKTEAGDPRTAPERTWHPFWELREEIENLFDNFYSGNALAPFQRWRRPGAEPTASRLSAGASIPKLDVIDKEDEVKLVAELPGMAESDIDVQVTNSTLTLSGEKREETEKGDKKGDYYLCERSFGSFRRSIRLPEGIDQDKIDAKFRNGVLTVHLPKKPEAQHPSRKIEVKAEK
ncbi:Hsp20/alpha crystallin family protein [uncultured Roseovarius sp.]|uniref:Hsp20/alpha crystallin family protein n=1 Tax=uncultured Roseovarius sp. TaxID=293344 RepID=UPI0025CDB206|nr:Hsp20/alpha crystallin family protein [uncultured Roseovarius sp.]